MKVCFVGKFIEGEILTGPEKVAKRIFCRFVDAGIQSVFLEYFFDGSAYTIWQKLFGAEHRIYLEKYPIFRLGLFRIPFFLLRTKPSVIHVITFERFAALVVLLARVSGIRILFNLHGVAFQEQRNAANPGSAFLQLKDRLAERMLLRFAYVVLSYTEESAHSVQQRFKLRSDKFRFIENGVDDIFFDAYHIHPQHGRLRCVIEIGRAHV